MKKKLSEFRIGEKGRILEINENEVQLAMLTLGVIPGESFKLTVKAPFGDPIAIQLAGTKVALRKSQAQHILAEVTE